LAAPIAVDHFAGQCAKRYVDVKWQTFRFYRSRTAALRRSIDVVDWRVMGDSTQSTSWSACRSSLTITAPRQTARLESAKLRGCAVLSIAGLLSLGKPISFGAGSL